jgi:hypothetical protein
MLAMELESALALPNLRTRNVRTAAAVIILKTL